MRCCVALKDSVAVHITGKRGRRLPAKTTFKTSHGNTFSKKTHLLMLCHPKQHFVFLLTASQSFQIVSKPSMLCFDFS